MSLNPNTINRSLAVQRVHSKDCVQTGNALGAHMCKYNILLCGSYIGGEFYLAPGVSRLIFFLFLQNYICCGYSLEVPHRGTSNEYPQHTFSLRNTNFINTFLVDKGATSWNYGETRN